MYPYFVSKIRGAFNRSFVNDSGFDLVNDEWDHFFSDLDFDIIRVFGGYFIKDREDLRLGLFIDQIDHFISRGLHLFQYK